MDCTADGRLERRPRALLLDGDPVVLDILRRSLEARSFAALTAGDGTSGVRLLLDELLDLDVVVMDLDLPHRDARSLARLIRLAGGERDLGLVVLAGAVAPALRRELLALGVDAIADWREGPAAVADVVLKVVRARTSAAAGSPERSAPAAPRRSPARSAFSFRRWSFLPA